MGYGPDGASIALLRNRRRGKGMTLQEWLEQEYTAWAHEGKPGGWSSGWVKYEVTLGTSKFTPKVTIDSDGQINISLRPMGGALREK